jgi:2,3-bisphosphoglycerate-dependent phosphoglycerate mutase
MPPAATWLIRHGQSTANAGLPSAGYEEVPLTALGHLQAREVARRVERQPDLLIVSPFLRAKETAGPIRERWPASPCEVWPIQELTYLSPERCCGTTPEIRRPWIEAYWRRCDPDYLDGPDAESFAAFTTRLRDFHLRLSAIDGGFVVAVGHGQFFRAYLMSRGASFAATAERMKGYRAAETAQPMANCEVIELDGVTSG